MSRFVLVVWIGALCVATPHVSTAQTPEKRPRWALVLSGGAARGIAHVGVIKALEETGLRPDVVYGTSMGAVVGALYASGLSAAEIERELDLVNWGRIFEPTGTAREWRTIRIAPPWLTLARGDAGLRLPSGFVDDQELDYVVARVFLPAEGMAQGDFDRLPIPFRAVASDLNTLAPVTIKTGSVSHAVRASLAIPVVFPPVRNGGRVLVDGGLAANLPVAPAREEGLDGMLAVDVALETKTLTENSSALEIGLTIIDRLDKRGQPATFREGEQLIWLSLKGFSATDFEADEAMIASAYKEALPQVQAFARKFPPGPATGSGSPSGRSDGPALPPPRAPLDWAEKDGKATRRTAVANRKFGAVPRDSFLAGALSEGYRHVYLAGIFRSAWPELRVRGDSTDVSFLVVPRDPAEFSVAAAWDLDRQTRAQAVFSLRPNLRRIPPQVLLGGTLRHFGWNAFAEFAPHALDRGSEGWFVRGNRRQQETRVFSAEDEWLEIENDRLEGFVGHQLPLPTDLVMQLGAGLGWVEESGERNGGLLASVRLDAGPPVVRRIEATAMFGQDGYGAVRGEGRYDLFVRPVTFRPSVTLGYASELAPLDEWPGLGGPEVLGGLRHGEWLGRWSLAGGLTFLYRAGRTVQLSISGQAGRADKSIGRPDLDGRIRFAGDIGAEVDIPFGPLRVDWGYFEGGQSRFDVTFGPWF